MKAGSLAKAAAGVLLVAAGASTSAQELFGNLLATDGPEAAHQKLKALGYSGFSLTERAGCKIDDKCLGTFTGPSISKGFVRFSPRGIRSVLLETSNPADIGAVLNRKYGTPSVPTPEPGNDLVTRHRNEHLPAKVWRLSSGVEIAIGKDGRVSYASPENFGAGADKSGLKNF